MVKILFFLGVLTFFLLFPLSTGREFISQPGPVQTPGSCLRDSDINTSIKYRCQNGPNIGQDYFRVIEDTVIVKKQLRVGGEWDPSAPIPPSCQGLIGNGPFGSTYDRRVRRSMRCSDSDIYELWCGDYCSRVLEAQLHGQSVQSVPLCGDVPGDDYLGCFNEKFIFKLKDPPFKEDQANHFEVYINDTTIPDHCLDVVAKYQEIATTKNIRIPAHIEALFQCYRDLQAQSSIKCSP